MDISVLIVTSPSLCHPSTILIDSVIDSLALIPHIHTYEVPIHIIMDGYHVIQTHVPRDSDELPTDPAITNNEAQDSIDVHDSIEIPSTFTAASKIRLKKGVIDQTIEENYLAYQTRIYEKYGAQSRYHIHRYAPFDYF